MEKKYKKPDLRIMFFTADDVILASSGGGLFEQDAVEDGIKFEWD